MNRYVNLDGSGHTKIPKMIEGLKKTIQNKLKNKGVPAPAVKPDIQGLLNPVKSSREARITWLGHSGWLIQQSGIGILIDPVLGKRVNIFIKAKARFGKRSLMKFIPVNAALITHDHYDHLQVRLLKDIDTKVIAGTGTGRFLKSKKLDAVELKWWETFKIGNVKFTFVPAKHGSRRGLLDLNMRLWGGFVIETPDLCIYHAGDTGYFEIFKELARSFKKIDIAFLPIGAYGPELAKKYSHLTPEQAVKAFIDLNAGLMIPMHWGTFQISHEPLDEPPQRLIKEWKRQGLDCDKLNIMAVGESFLFRK